MCQSSLCFPTFLWTSLPCMDTYGGSDFIAASSVLEGHCALEEGTWDLQFFVASGGLLKEFALVLLLWCFSKWNDFASMDIHLTSNGDTSFSLSSLCRIQDDGNTCCITLYR